MTGPAIVPFATLELLPDHPRGDGQTWMGGALTASRGVVFHVNAGNGDPYNWWTNPADPNVASAHLQIMKSGELRQYVPLDRIAWAEVDGNGSWHSVETEGFPTELLTDAQFATFARLLAWGHTSGWGWPLQVCDDPSGTGLGTHQMGGAAWGGHACPGPVRAAQRPALLAAAQQIAAGQPGPTVGDVMTEAQAAQLAAIASAVASIQVTVADSHGGLLVRVAALQGQVSALTQAVGHLSAGGTLDTATIAAAAETGAKAALHDLGAALGAATGA